MSSLILDSAGNLEAQANVKWKENVIFNFMENGNGSYPQDPMAFNPEGNIYGPTSGGGPSVEGLVFSTYGEINAVPIEPQQ
jgi:hypothetical protein